MMEMGFSSLDQQNKLGIMGDDDDDHGVSYDDDDDSVSSDVSSLVSSDGESDDTSEENSSDVFPSSDPRTDEGALADMSDLLQQLPFKRGLSKHFQGKSQSFTSLANVICLEDLAKPENPYNKKLKSCKSYMGLSQAFSPSPPTRSASSSKLFSKKSSRASCSSLNAKRNDSFLGLSSKPPMPHGHANTTTTSTFSPLFV